ISPPAVATPSYCRPPPLHGELFHRRSEVGRVPGKNRVDDGLPAHGDLAGLLSSARIQAHSAIRSKSSAPLTKRRCPGTSQKWERTFMFTLGMLPVKRRSPGPKATQSNKSAIDVIMSAPIRVRDPA